MLTTITMPSHTSNRVVDIGSPAALAPPPQMYMASIPSQLSGGPGRAGATLPMMPTMPSTRAKIAMKVST